MLVMTKCQQVASHIIAILTKISVQKYYDDFSSNHCYF